MRKKNILGLSLISLIILLSLPVFCETIILESEKGQQYELKKLMRINPSDILMGLNKQKLVYIQREEYDKPNHSISFLDESGNIYQIYQVQDIILEADVFNGELYTLEAKCYPEYSIRKVKAIANNNIGSGSDYKGHPWVWIDKMDLNIRKYKDDNPQAATIMSLGTITGSYNSYRNRLAGLVITNNQAKVIFYERHTDMVNFDKSTDIHVCNYLLDESEPSSSFKVTFENKLSIYNHDSKYLYLFNRINNEGDVELCKLIQMNIDSGETQVILNDAKIVAFGIDSESNFIYMNYSKDSGKTLYCINKVSPEAPLQYIDKIFIPYSFRFAGLMSKLDMQLEKFIIPVYDSSSNIYEIYLLGSK